MQRVAGLLDAGDRHAHRKCIEDEVLDAVELRREDDDARSSRAGHETLLRDLHVRAAVGHADVVVVVREAGVKVVDGVQPERLRTAERPQLRAAERQRVEARHIRAALLAGIRVVETVVVDEVVRRQQTEAAGVAVHAKRPLVIAHRLRKRACGERVHVDIR